MYPKALYRLLAGTIIFLAFMLLVPLWENDISKSFSENDTAVSLSFSGWCRDRCFLKRLFLSFFIVCYGGLVQLIAGIWEIALENTFGATALCSYGGFWLSFGAIYIPWFGILEAYKDKESDLGNALGFYLLGWTIFTYGLTLCTLKSTVAFFALFFLLALVFLLLSIGEFSGKVGCKRAGGVVGVVVAFIAWYNAYAGVASRQNSYIVAHPFPLPTNEKTLY